MILWWIGNAVFILVVIPVVLLLLHRLLAPVLEIKKQTDVILDGAGGILIALDDVPALIRTRDLVKQVGAGLVRYVTAVDRVL